MNYLKNSLKRPVFATPYVASSSITISPYPHVESSGAGCLGGFSGRIPREGVVELSSPFRRKSRLQLVESEGEECVCLRCVDSAVDGVAPS